MPGPTLVEAPEIEAGTLDRRVDLLAPVYNVPEDEIPSWTVVDTVWAQLAPNLGMEMNEAGRTIAIVTTPIVIRYRTDIDHRWRVQYTADSITHTYEIEGIVNIGMRRAQLQLNCKEIL